MALILDTNALSAFAAGDRELLRVLPPQRLITVPAIVLGEFLFGVRQLRNRSEFEDWLVQYGGLWQLLDVNADTASHYADIRLDLKRAGRPIPTNDLWIAALARQHQSAVVTRDRHFDNIPGLAVMSW
ncbi:MAG: type II toxin-antitoxin system VapC family toxin [Acidobacteria bacterium]|nr:type II toxin-antitoxin system VapC family toxin [Acidobacteriota bacterium]